MASVVYFVLAFLLIFIKVANNSGPDCKYQIKCLVSVYVSV